MKRGEDLDNCFLEKTVASAELAKIVEPISDRRLKTCMYKGFSEYKDIEMMMHRDSTFDIDQMQRTTRHIYLDGLSNSNEAKGEIAGRGAAMADGTTICNSARRTVISPLTAVSSATKTNNLEVMETTTAINERATHINKRRADDLGQDPKTPLDRNSVLFSQRRYVLCTGCTSTKTWTCLPGFCCTVRQFSSFQRRRQCTIPQTSR